MAKILVALPQRLRLPPMRLPPLSENRALRFHHLPPKLNEVQNVTRFEDNEMRFVTVRDFRVNPAKLWRQVEADDLVVTSNGRPIALLSPLDPERVDETLTLLDRLRAQMAVSRLRKAASDGSAKALTDDDIDAEITAARRDR